MRRTLRSSSDLFKSWLSHDTTFHSFTPEEASQIRQALLFWYQNNRRKLPWRGDPPPWDGGDELETNSSTATTSFPVTPYGVWISEIMLQQTRVQAVIPFWLKWMHALPTVQDLARATPEHVNALWAGLGYYRRARLLHQAAKDIIEKYDGQIPDTFDGLMTLPGIGRYTASAIASIAYNITVPVVDGNVCRVLCRLRAIAQHQKSPALKDKWAWTLADQILQAGDRSQPGSVNQAFMELGATYCTPSGTGIDPSDPLRDYYWSTCLGKAINEELVACRGRNPDYKEDEWLMQIQERVSESSGFSACQVCADGGVMLVVKNIASIIEENFVNAVPSDPPRTKLIDEEASKCGHAAFPISPPKLAKREEVLAVAVVSCKFNNHPSDDQFWLFVQRHDSGLLANQWEFPSVCVWNSERDTPKVKSRGTKRKDMSNEVPIVLASVRQKALDLLLKELRLDTHQKSMLDWKLLKSRQRLENPLEHIFSHVRHTMWIEHCTTATELDETAQEWTDGKGRKVRWMRESDMNNVGVTAGVKKILQMVQQPKHESGIKPSRRKTK